jgi:hypothetical protein
MLLCQLKPRVSLLKRIMIAAVCVRNTRVSVLTVDRRLWKLENRLLGSNSRKEKVM